MRSYEALVDYGNLSSFERQVVRTMVPFYSWQKGMLRLVARFPIDHPVAAGITMMLGRLNEELARDQFGEDMPEGYLGLIPLPGGGAFNTRSLNPFQDAAALTTPQGIASSVNPYIQAIVRNALGAPEGGFVKYQRVNEFGQAVPDTSLPEDIGATFTGVPQARLVTGLGGPQPTQAAGRFFGVPAYTQADVQKILARTRRSRNTVAGIPNTQPKQTQTGPTLGLSRLYGGSR
jgi:hypothetical protein